MGSHVEERRQLEEVTNKYHGLKAKVRRYQRHCEAKEEHYRGEYSRLESEFRSTLETLKGRMEVAYSAKEQQVEAELGTMREHLSSELRKAVGEKVGVGGAIF